MKRTGTIIDVRAQETRVVRVRVIIKNYGNNNPDVIASMRNSQDRPCWIQVKLGEEKETSMAQFGQFDLTRWMNVPVFKTLRLIELIVS